MDSNKDKIYNQIEQAPLIHQADLVSKTGISKGSVRKILGELRADKKIIGRKNGRRTEFSIPSYHEGPDRLIDSIEKTAESLNEFIRSVTKEHKKYQPKTLEFLYRRINSIREELPLDVKDSDDAFRQDDDVEDYDGGYQEKWIRIIETAREIGLERSLKSELCKHGGNANDLFDEIVSLLYGEKNKMRQMGGNHPQRPKTKDRIKLYEKDLRRLCSHQGEIMDVLCEIKKSKNSKPGSDHTYDEEIGLARKIKKGRNELNRWQEEMNSYEEEINEFRQDVTSDRFYKQKNVTAIVETAKKHLSDTKTSFDGLAKSLERLENSVITNEHMQKLRSKISAYEKHIRVYRAKIKSDPAQAGMQGTLGYADPPL